MYSEIAEKAKILPLRERAKVINCWLEKRLTIILPELMQREGLDLWVVIARENHDEPIVKTLLPVPMIAGDEGHIMPTTRRWMFLVFNRQADGSMRYMMIGGPGIGNAGLYETLWPRENENEWQCLNRIVTACQPSTIGLNYSETFAMADGLGLTEYRLFQQYVDENYVKRVRSAERLAVGWLERRLPEELEAYPGLNQVAHAVISRAFSSQVVHSGITNALDVSWWIRQQFVNLGLRSWFMPMVSIVREGQTNRIRDGIIHSGDILHCDIGLRYLGLLTDTQQMAYVLRPQESDAPLGLKQGLKLANQLQDIHMQAMKAGLTGNEILASARAKAIKAGIEPRIWTHPIGYHGHGAGPLIGVWDKQEGVPGRGDYPLYNDTCYAMELCAYYAVPEWNHQKISFNIEETIAFSQGQGYYFNPRQTTYHLIR